jgi:hypothetical protein
VINAAFCSTDDKNYENNLPFYVIDGVNQAIDDVILAIDGAFYVINCAKRGIVLPFYENDAAQRAVDGVFGQV